MKNFISFGNFSGMTPDDMREWLRNNTEMQNLIDAFVAVDFQCSIADDETYDYKEDTKAHQWALWVYDRWRMLYDELLEKVMLEARKEGFEIQDKAYFPVLIPFMEKYGYTASGGWWVKKL